MYMHKTFLLALEQTLHRDTHHAGYDAGNIIRCDAIAEHDTRARTCHGDLMLELGNRSKAQTWCSFIVTIALYDLKLMFDFLKVALSFLVAL